MMRRTLVFLMACAAVGLAAVPLSMAQKNAKSAAKKAKPAASPQKKAGAELVVDYTGVLQDQEAKPVSGVFQLQFNLYDGEHAKRSQWNERHFVAVVDGSYTVPLGANSALQRDQIPDDAFIGVELVGEGELLRDRFQLGGAAAPSSAEQPPSSQDFEISQETRKLLESARENKQIAFADVAERAVTADKAEVAVKALQLGELTADQVEKKAEVALERLGDHIADPDAHAATGGIRLGSERAVQKRIGGTGGSPYQSNCPPGYVVTGIKGGSGKLLDSIRLICQKLR